MNKLEEVKVLEKSLQQSKSVNGKQSYYIGILCAIIATLIFSGQDAITKTLVGYYPATFFVMVRFWVFFVVGLYMVKTARGGMIANMKTRRPIIQCLRGCLLLFQLVVFATALKHMGLAEVTAIFQSYPLFGTIIAVFLLKEHVGWQRISALMFGFIGILIMVRPGFGVISYGAFWAIGAAVLFSLYLALTRLVGDSDKPQTSFFYVGLIGFVGMSSFFPLFWVQIGTEHIWLLCLLCLTSVSGHFLMIKALSIAPLTLIQPFNYLQLVWSVVLGYIVFKEMPDILTLFGASLIIVSGLFVFYREHKHSSKLILK